MRFTDDLIVIFIVTVVVLFVIAMVIQAIKKNKETKFREKLKADGFDITKEISHNEFLLFQDETNKKWAVKQSLKSAVKVFDYKDLADAEIFADDIMKAKLSSFGKDLSDKFVSTAAMELPGSNADDREREELRHKMCSLKIDMIVTNGAAAGNRIPLKIFDKAKKDVMQFALALSKAKLIASMLKTIQNNNETAGQKPQEQP